MNFLIKVNQKVEKSCKFEIYHGEALFEIEASDREDAIRQAHNLIVGDYNEDDNKFDGLWGKYEAMSVTVYPFNEKAVINPEQWYTEAKVFLASNE